MKSDIVASEGLVRDAEQRDKEIGWKDPTANRSETASANRHADMSVNHEQSSSAFRVENPSAITNTHEQASSAQLSSIYNLKQDFTEKDATVGPEALQLRYLPDPSSLVKATVAPGTHVRIRAETTDGWQNVAIQPSGSRKPAVPRQVVTGWVRIGSSNLSLN